MAESFWDSLVDFANSASRLQRAASPLAQSIYNAAQVGRTRLANTDRLLVLAGVLGRRTGRQVTSAEMLDLLLTSAERSAGLRE